MSENLDFNKQLKRLTFYTDYKVGDILYGQNSLNFKVIKINPNNTIDIQFLPPRDYTDIYYFFNSGTWKYYRWNRDKDGIPIEEGKPDYGYNEVAFGEDYDFRENFQSWDNGWKRMPADKIIRGIDPRRTGIAVDFYYNTKQVIERQLNWWGNGYDWGQGPMVVYGDPPYGYYYVPRDTSQVVPTKGHTDAEWRPNWGLDDSWSVVAGSYRWLQTGNYDDYYGWHRKDNYGPGLNIYQKRISIQFQKGDTGKLQSGVINFSKLKEVYTILKMPSIEPYVEQDLDPVRLFAYDGSFSGGKDYNSVVNNEALTELKLHPLKNIFLDNTTKEHKITLMPVWSEIARLQNIKINGPKDDEEKKDIKDEASISEFKYQFSPDGNTWGDWKTLDNNVISLEGKTLDKYLGYYNFYIKGTYKDYYLIKGTDGVLRPSEEDKFVILNKEYYYSMEIRDDNPVLKPVIFEYQDPNIGRNGNKNGKGTPIINKVDNKIYYLHIKYSNDNGKTFTDNNGEKLGTYIGKYFDEIESDSDDISKYTWEKFNENTNKIKIGEKNFYYHIRYANKLTFDSNNGMQKDPAMYIGGYIDKNPDLNSESENHSDYNWSKNTVYRYDMNRDITDGQRQPAWIVDEGHTYTGYYDYYEYTDEGYNCILRNSKIPLKLSKDNNNVMYVTVPFKENGQYYIKIEANYRGLRRITEEAVFLIDTRLPNLPTIITNNTRRYTGPLAETAYDMHLNSVILDIEYPPFCIPDNFKVEYKRFNFDSWTTISGELNAENRSAIITPQEQPDVNHNNDGTNEAMIKTRAAIDTSNLPSSSTQISTDNRYGIFNRIGTYRVTVRSRKTTLDPSHTAPAYAPYVSGRYAVSNGYSEAIFKVKRKFTYKIVVDTERPTYRVKVAIDFANPVDTNIQSSDKFASGTMHKLKSREELTEQKIKDLNLKFGDSIQYETYVTIVDPFTGEVSKDVKKIVTETWTGSEFVQDYGNVDLYNNKLYRIDGGEWKYYLAPIYIYENCIIECKSVDEDGFESYITRKEITNIDKSTPDDPIVNYYDTTEDGETILVQMNSSETITFNTNKVFNID